jgi:hypothetical protein
VVMDLYLHSEYFGRNAFKMAKSISGWYAQNPNVPFHSCLVICTDLENFRHLENDSPRIFHIVFSVIFTFYFPIRPQAIDFFYQYNSSVLSSLRRELF